MKDAGKNKEEAKVVVNSAGSAGESPSPGCFLPTAKAYHYGCDINGILSKNSPHLNWMREKMVGNQSGEQEGTLSDALEGADIFVGVSAP